MSISRVLANCLEAAHYDSSMFPLALPACDYNVLTSWADQYRLKLVLNTDSLMIIEQFISTSIQKLVQTVPLMEMYSDLCKIITVPREVSYQNS